MKKAAAYLILIRPVNFAITFITVIVAAAISYISVYPVGKVMLAALTASLTLSAGNIINDIFDMSAKVRMQFMHLVVLPLQTESVVLAFYHKRDKLYRNLRHQINNTSEQKTLQFLNYLVFAYTENYFISKTIQTEIEKNKKLSLLSQENNENPTLGFLNADNHFGIGYQPINLDEIPNFLSDEYATI